MFLSANFPGGDDKELAGEEFFSKFIAYYHSIYAERPEVALTEDELTKLRIPMSIYGLTKLIDEVLMAKYEAMHGLKWMALRYFNVCGAAVSTQEASPLPPHTQLDFFQGANADRETACGCRRRVTLGRTRRARLH